MSEEVEKRDETILNLPSIEERLGALRPSRQLLEFYRRKTEELETEHDKLFTKIEGSKVFNLSSRCKYDFFCGRGYLFDIELVQKRIGLRTS